jgi:uncharacterized protein (DUF488 family)
MGPTLYTFGHGANDRDAIARLIVENRLALVSDVRTVPKSRKHPQFGRDEMQTWVPAETPAEYRWDQALGGFRRTSADSPNIALRHPAFRGYADYMRVPEFRNALALVLQDARERSTAVMCSETLWWRCHRRLIADAATLLHNFEVIHLFANAKPSPHVVTLGARVDGDRLIYDAHVDVPLPL